MTFARLAPLLLIIAICEAAGASGDDEAIDFNIPALSLHEATAAFGSRIHRDTYIGNGAFAGCKDLLIKPLVGRYTPTEAWRRLTAPICAYSGVVIEHRYDAPVYMIDHPWVRERTVRIISADDPFVVKIFRPRPGCSCEPAIVEPHILASLVVEPNVADIGIAMPMILEPEVTDRLDLEATTVVGNRNLPKVMFVVPWKKSEIGEPPTQPFNTLLDEALAPLDRDVFRREIDYYEATFGKDRSGR
jgi:hypothetical protein